MLKTALYLRPALDRFVLMLPELAPFKLTSEEWTLAETLFTIIQPFFALTTRFESNSSTAEIDYVFYAYESMFSHTEDLQLTLSRRGRGARANAYLLEAINASYEQLKKHYGETTKTFIYGDANILNPRCKMGIFRLESWRDQDPDEYLEGLRRRIRDGGYYDISESETNGNDLKRSHCGSQWGGHHGDHRGCYRGKVLNSALSLCTRTSCYAEESS
jgi:hypothetical protein